MKKITIIILIIIIILFVGIIIFDSKCETTKTGWVCEFKTGITNPIQKLRCKIFKGEWKCYGRCFGKFYNCELPFGDGGKKCTKSNQCEGVCLANISTFEEFEKHCPEIYEDSPYKRGGCLNIIGACSSYPKKCTSYYYFLDDDIVGQYMELCD